MRADRRPPDALTASWAGTPFRAPGAVLAPRTRAPLRRWPGHALAPRVLLALLLLLAPRALPAQTPVPAAPGAPVLAAPAPAASAAPAPAPPPAPAAPVPAEPAAPVPAEPAAPATVVLPDFVAALAPAQRAVWQELTVRAAAQSLWDERFWRLLLHYMPDWSGGGFTSEADGPGFFLAPRGKTDPRAELEGTLAAFFSAEIIAPGEMTPQCTFPARYRWLNERLGFDAARLPPQPCPRFEEFQSRLDPASVSLIFSSYYFNNPASMFGHTLLRFNRKGRSADAALLDSAVNYSASVPAGDGNVGYALKGMFGGYQGYFSLLPYYLKVREYNDLENRDLWEYRLRFTPSQMDYLLRHTWELGSTSFDYFFFKENCSYHLLSILEVGRPELHLRERYHAWTMPTETVQDVMAQPGLVDEVIYRPSQSSQIDQRLAVMSNAERDWVRRLIDAPEAAGTAEFQALPLPRAALLLDAAIDYFQYRLAGRPQGELSSKARLRALLLRRSRIPASAVPALELPPQSSPPHEGHDSRRVEVSAGAARPPEPGPGSARESHPFVELSAQLAFHDLLSDDRAFAPDSQIELGHLRVRYEPDPARWRLERFALLDIVSLFPRTLASTQPSWKLAIGWQRNRELGCALCAPLFFNPGIGLAVQSHLLRREVYFLMLEASAEFDSHFESGHRAGFGLGAGVLLHLSDAWRIGLIGTRTHYTAGDAGYVGEASLQQRLSLSRNLEAVLDWRGVQRYREARLGLGWYF